MNHTNDYQLRPTMLVKDPVTGKLVEGPFYVQGENDLNMLRINVDRSDVRDWSGHLRDHSGTFHPPAVRVYHRHLAPALMEHIQDADMVVGAVAWLTHPDLLEVMRGVRDGVAMVVQKEDFLRPDVGERKNFSKRLRERYDALPSVTSQYVLPGIARNLCVCTILDMQPVRCVGNHNRDRRPAFPRMHNKFLVFCRCDADGTKPYAVWTGSFNLTKNASASFENAVYIECPSVAEAYASEWAQIFALSEPLNWESDWCAPEFRVGT